MRLKIYFETKKMPLFYRMGILSTIKQAIKQADVDYFQQVFSDKQTTKTFAYAVFLDRFQINGDEIDLAGFSLTISSGDLELMIHLFNGLQACKEYTYKNYSWKRSRVEMLPEKQITSGKVLFETCSPLLIESKNGKPLAPDDAAYEQEFNYYANLVIQTCEGRSLYQPLKVKPIQMKKQVIKESHRSLQTEQAETKVLYFTCFKGSLLVEGHPDDLQSLYVNGISKRRSFGFGLLDVAMEGR